MAYADQQMSGSKITALVIVALIHIAVGYLLVSGLAYSAATKIMKKMTVVDVKDDKPKEPPPPPPPPPKDMPPPPPIVAPPPPINVAVAPPAVQTVVTPPPVVAPPAPVLAPPAPVPAPPAPKFAPKAAVAKGDPSTWVTTDDYPARALRENRAGTTGFSLSIGADGRVTGCTVTSSSGSEDLDQATCTYASRRARFKPATDGEGNPTSGSYSSRVKWVIPKD